MQRLLHTLKYHNGVPIALSLVLLGAGSAFAATPEVRDALFQSQQRVVAIDNTYLVQKNLDGYSPQVSIGAVTEDTDAYYVAYTLSTINVVDGVWRDVTEAKTLKVDKGVLGTTLDLGLYVTEQLKQVVDAQVAYLREVQGIEQRQVSQKVIATEYSGLVGKFLTTETEVLPGYVPVVAPVPESMPLEGQVASASGAAVITPEQPVATVPTPTSSGLTVMGNNPARIDKGSSYVDLGVVITNPHYLNFGVKTTLNGTEVSEVVIDTSVAGEYSIVYTVTDADGASISATKTVLVIDPNPVITVPVATSTATTTE